MSKAALEKEKEHVEDFAPEVGGVSLVCVGAGSLVGVVMVRAGLPNHIKCTEHTDML